MDLWTSLHIQMKSGLTAQMIENLLEVICYFSKLKSHILELPQTAEYCSFKHSTVCHAIASATSAQCRVFCNC